MSEFEIRDEPGRRTAVIHGTMPQDELPGFMDDAFYAVFHAIGAAGLVPGDAPFTRYFAFEPDGIDLEVGTTIAEIPGARTKAFEGSGDVRPGKLPAGPVAVGWHVGPYDTIGGTYERLLGWVSEQGREPSGAMWEVYMTDPHAEPDPAKWRTLVCIPLA